MKRIFYNNTVVSESSRDRYDAEQPDSNYWSDINKFARFPQGLPSNIYPGSLSVKKKIIRR